MKFLIAGLGSIGRRHFRNLIALGEKDIVLLRTRKATLPDDELAGYPVETDIHEAIQKHAPDAVIVANPTALHLDIAIPAAEVGCHILLENPFEEMSKVWKFLNVKEINDSLEEEAIKAEMSSNPDEEWQAERDEEIASFLLKGQAGNWQRLFTQRDKSLFKKVSGDMLVKWGYERDLNW
jgi:saccharopine dehydrogenase-like NADP-dependent oxidoreductase